MQSNAPGRHWSYDSDLDRQMLSYSSLLLGRSGVRLPTQPPLTPSCLGGAEASLLLQTWPHYS